MIDIPAVDQANHVQQAACFTYSPISSFLLIQQEHEHQNEWQHHAVDYLRSQE